MSTIEEALKKQKRKQTDIKAVSNKGNDSSSVIELEPKAEPKMAAQKADVNNAPSPNQKPTVQNQSDDVSSYIQLNLSSYEGVSDNPQTVDQRIMSEEFRQVKRKLLNNAFGVISKTLPHSNLIMVSSAQANEGKTFVSINLALSIALEQDKTVLLVDADILKPSIPTALGFEDRIGLIDYLSGNCPNIEDIIYSTNLPNLKIIPAGSAHSLANELLASEKMASLCLELERRYNNRIVLFDSPPLLGVNETSLLAQLMGQALIVVEEDKSSLQEIQKANELLPEDLAKGLVLNKAIHSQKELYGYYGYGYGKR